MTNGPRSQTVDQQNDRSAILHEAQESSMKVRALRNVKLEGLVIAIMVMFRPNLCYFSTCEKNWLREEDRLGNFTRPKRLQNLFGTEIAMNAA